MAAARLGPADARIPCPLCGGLIHPIAGRCKHCKGDLSALRGARPSAAAALPALHATSPNPPPLVNGNGHGHAYANGHASEPAAPPQNLVQAVAAAAAPSSWPVGAATAVAIDGAQPILPPRPTGRFEAPAPRSSWKSWPVIVIIVAVIAIVVAVVLMLWPPEPTDDRVTGAMPTAGPERMNTNPMPTVPGPQPSPQPADPDDPWAPPQGRGGGAPSVPKDPAPPDDVDIDDIDPGAANPGAMPVFPGGRSSMPIAIAQHTCVRLAQCGGIPSSVGVFCRQVSAMSRVSPPSCAAATRCLKQIDELECDDLRSDPLGAVQSPPEDCADALSC